MQIFHIITHAILFGLTLSLMIGPAFFTLLQTSISEGFRRGSHLALGVSLSDVIMVFVAWYGFSSFFDNPQNKQIVSIIGGVVIVVFGIYTATRRHVTVKQRHNIIKKNTFQFKYLGQGFICNLANPGTWLFWLIPIGLSNAYDRRLEQILFLAVILFTNLCMDLLKCAVANELKRFLTDNVITIINRVVGSILILFGIFLAISTFFSNTTNGILNL